MCKNSTILFVAAIILIGCIAAMKTYSMKNVTGEQEKMEMIERPSGLKVQALHRGNGQTTPKPGQRVSVHYTGWLDDGNGNPGKKFDSSVDRKAPFTFVVGKGEVIKGWDEGLLEMKVGDKYRLIIPAPLGYGTRGCPGAIPPNATLIFDVELLSVS